MKAASLIKPTVFFYLLLAPLSISSPVPTQDAVFVDRDIKRLKDSSSKFSIQIIDDMSDWEDAAEQAVEDLIDSVTPSEQVFGVDGILYNDQEITEAEGFSEDQEEEEEQEETDGGSPAQQEEQTAVANALDDQAEDEDDDINQILMDTPVDSTVYNGVEYTPYDDLDFETEEDRISREGEVKADVEFRNGEIFLPPGCDISGSTAVESNTAFLIICVIFSTLTML